MSCLRIHFRSGTTILAHGDLISFLHKDDLKIFHRKRSEIEFIILRHYYSEDSLENVVDHVSSELSLSKEVVDSVARNLFQELLTRGIVDSFQNKDFNNEYELKEVESHQLLHLLVMLTNRCNMDCKYCYTEANQHLNEERELSGKEWIELFDKVKISGNYRSQNISFTGGEPTIHPDFPEILRSVSGKYKIEVSSNGLYLADNVIRALTDCESLHFFDISMDSYKPEEDEVMRGKGTYKPRLDNIKLLSEYHIPICISTVVSSITLPSLKETTEYFLEEFPEISIKYIPITRMGRALNLDGSLFLTRNDAKIYVDIVLEMKERYGDRLLTDPSSFNSPKNSYSHWSGRCSHMKLGSERSLYKEDFYDNVKLPPERCNAGFGVVSISPSGRLRPCLRPNSFYSEAFEYVSKDVLMPSLIGLERNEIGQLYFWKIVTSEASSFDPLKTCALKTVLSQNQFQHKS